METGSFMISRSAEDTARQFQTYLRKSENDDKLVILEAEDEPGSKLGDNYTSVMIRTKLIGTRGNGSTYTKSFMTKTLSQERAAAALLGLSNLFRNEGHVYHKVLPVLGSFGPRCIHYDEKNIIMEDLAEKGYANCDRRDLLDLDHTVLTLKTLAKLHASALAVKIKNPQLFDELAVPLKEVIYTEDSVPQMEDCTRFSTKATVKYLEILKPRTQELQDIIDMFVAYTDNVYNIFKRLFNGPRHKYFTICHGDPWTNNLLFLHDDNGKILDIKMVDYQISRHTSVASDIHYLIYTSVQSSLIEKSYESLIKIYHNAFLGELRRLRVGEEILVELGPEWLEAELRNYQVYGIIVGCWMVHAILADEEDVKKFEEINMQNMDDFDISQITLNNKKLDRINSIVTHCYRRYHLGIINDDLEPIPITD